MPPWNGGSSRDDRRGSSEQSLERGEAAGSVGMPSGAGPSTNSTRLPRTTSVSGVASEEREPAPPFGVLDRLEQEPLAVADQLHEGGERCLEVGEHFAPDRHDRVLVAQRDELVERRSHLVCVDHAGPGVAPLPKSRKKHERSPV